MAAFSGFPYHAQNNDKLCAIACAQMILLGAMAAVDAQVIFDQDLLLSALTSAAVDRPPANEGSSWHTTPRVLAGGLNAFLRDQPYVIYVTRWRDVVLKTLASLVESEVLPTVALVDGGRHWVVVSGVWRQPENQELMGFQVLDPKRWGVAGPGATHLADGSCCAHQRRPFFLPARAGGMEISPPRAVSGRTTYGMGRLFGEGASQPGEWQGRYVLIGPGAGSTAGHLAVIDLDSPDDGEQVAMDAAVPMEMMPAAAPTASPPITLADMGSDESFLGPPAADMLAPDAVLDGAATALNAFPFDAGDDWDRMRDLVRTADGATTFLAGVPQAFQPINGTSEKRWRIMYAERGQPDQVRFALAMHDGEGKVLEWLAWPKSPLRLRDGND